MRSQRWSGLILVVPLGFLLWGFSQMYHKNSAYASIADQLPEERATAKRVGVPLSTEDLPRTPLTLEAQNAAPRYQKISAQLEQIPLNVWGSLRAVMLDQAGEPERKLTRLTLAEYHKAMEEAEQIAQLPTCDFHRDLSVGINLTYPENGVLRQLVRLYTAKACLQFEDGQPIPALHSLLIAAQITHHTGEDTGIVPLNTRMIMEMTIERPLNRIVARYGDRDDVLRTANQIEEIFATQLDIRRALQVECLLRVETLRRLRKNDPHALPVGALASYPIHSSHPIVQDAWEVRCLSYWKNLFVGLNNAGEDSMEILRSVKAISETEKLDSIGEKRWRPKPTYELDFYLAAGYTDYTNVAQRLVGVIARQRLRRTQLALLAYRQRTRSFPQQLEALSPPPPDDPFARQPLHYQKTGSGFVLYSVGPNLADDNGDGKPRMRDEDPPDIVLTYPYVRKS
jgi:hypothetical protein